MTTRTTKPATGNQVMHPAKQKHTLCIRSSTFWSNKIQIWIPINEIEMNILSPCTYIFFIWHDIFSTRRHTMCHWSTTMFKFCCIMSFWSTKLAQFDHFTLKPPSNAPFSTHHHAARAAQSTLRFPAYPGNSFRPIPCDIRAQASNFVDHPFPLRERQHPPPAHPVDQQQICRL